MKFKFKYKKILFEKGGSLLLPIIPIGLENKGKGFSYEALIDSGADMNLFPWDIADYFGFKKKEAKRKDTISGISGKPLVAYLFNVIFVVGGGAQKHIAPCWFAEKLPDTQHGFLGQKGFFDQYRIEFCLKKESITLWSDE